MNRFRLALAITATVAAAAFGMFGGKANAVSPAVSLSPNPATAGAAVTITVTVNDYGPCNNGITPPPPGSPFDSTIQLYDAGHNLVAAGSFPGGTSVGTIVLPANAAIGAYNVEVSCSISLGNGVFFPTNPLTVNAGGSPPVVIDDPPTDGGTRGGGSTAVLAPPVEAPVVAVPRVTG